MKTAIIQQANSADSAANRLRLIDKINDCAAQGAQLVVLQELHDSLYFCQTEDVDNFDLAVDINNGPELAAYRQAAANNGVVLVTSLFERRAPGLYHNTAVVIDSDG